MTLSGYNQNIEKKGKWYYYSVSVTYVKEDSRQRGVWLMGSSANARNPKRDHGMDMYKLNGLEGK